MYGTAASVLIHATIARISEVRKTACVGAFKLGMGNPLTEKPVDQKWIVPATRCQARPGRQRNPSLPPSKFLGRWSDAAKHQQDTAHHSRDHDRGMVAATTWPNFGRWAEESPERGCAGGGARRQLLFEVAMARVGTTAPRQCVAGADPWLWPAGKNAHVEPRQGRQTPDSVWLTFNAG